MSEPKTLLDLLRERTVVDCDLLDASIARQYGPFEDCTSNQAIAFGEIPQEKHRDLVMSSTSLARSISSEHPNVSIETLAIEICVRSS